MSNTIASPDLGVPQIQQNLVDAGQEREAMLRKLLPYDYDYAKDSGLLDFFYYDPATGRDALTHILGGEVRTNKVGVPVPSGFHHEPSVPHIWDGPNASGHYPTYTVETPEEPLDHHPMQPYSAPVVIGGIFKRGVRYENGGPTYVAAENSFFPREFDSLAVMQSLKHAYDNRDTTKDQLHVGRGVTDFEPRYVSWGNVPLLNGLGSMSVKMVMHFEEERLLTAMPKITPESQMNLTEDQMWAHLLQPAIKE